MRVRFSGQEAYSPLPREHVGPARRGRYRGKRPNPAYESRGFARSFTKLLSSFDESTRKPAAAQRVRGSARLRGTRTTREHRGARPRVVPRSRSLADRHRHECSSRRSSQAISAEVFDLQVCQWTTPTSADSSQPLPHESYDRAQAVRKAVDDVAR